MVILVKRFIIFNKKRSIHAGLIERVSKRKIVYEKDFFDISFDLVNNQSHIVSS